MRIMGIADQTQYSRPLALVWKNNDILMGVAVVGILVFMIIPLPTMLLDR